MLKGEGVDHVAAAIFKEAIEQLDVFETTPVAAAWGGAGEVALEGFKAFDAVFWKDGFVFEEQCVEHLGGDVVDDAAGGADGFCFDFFAEFFLQVLLHVHGAEGGVIGFGEDVLGGGLVF